MIALGGFHVHKLNAYSPLAAMADEGTHLQLPGRTIVINGEMDFNFRSYGVLDFA
jgi:hypothetical protein